MEGSKTKATKSTDSQIQRKMKLFSRNPRIFYQHPMNLLAVKNSSRVSFLVRHRLTTEAIPFSSILIISSLQVAKEMKPNRNPPMALPTIPTYTEGAESENSTASNKTSEVQFFSVPLVAAFTLQQNSYGILQKVIPLNYLANGEYISEDRAKNIEESIILNKQKDYRRPIWNSTYRSSIGSPNTTATLPAPVRKPKPGTEKATTAGAVCKGSRAGKIQEA